MCVLIPVVQDLQWIVSMWLFEQPESGLGLKEDKAEGLQELNVRRESTWLPVTRDPSDLIERVDDILSWIMVKDEVVEPRKDRGLLFKPQKNKQRKEILDWNSDSSPLH